MTHGRAPGEAADGAVVDHDAELLREVARDPLTAHVRRMLLERCGLAKERSPDPVPIVVGCSGGPDSTALAAMLAAIGHRARRGGPTIAPIVVAVHHGIRSEADEECAMVAHLARRLALRFERIDVRPAERSGNLAANARDDRYEALTEAAKRHGARHVAVAHHGGDRLETLLLGIARGRGLRGASQPRWRRRLGHGCVLVRPLLATTKASCVELCERNGLPYAIDPSNADPTRGRGFLRREVVPAMLRRWPLFEVNASRLGDEAGLALAALEATISRRFGPPSQREWRRGCCRAADPLLVAWAIRRAAVAMTPELATRISRDTWDRVGRAACDAKRSPRRFELGARSLGSTAALYVDVRANTVRLVREADADA